MKGRGNGRGKGNQRGAGGRGGSQAGWDTLIAAGQQYANALDQAASEAGPDDGGDPAPVIVNPGFGGGQVDPGAVQPAVGQAPPPQQVYQYVPPVIVNVPGYQVQRFPTDLVFTQDALMGVYTAAPDPAADIARIGFPPTLVIDLRKLHGGDDLGYIFQASPFIAMSIMGPHLPLSGKMARLVSYLVIFVFNRFYPDVESECSVDQIAELGFLYRTFKLGLLIGFNYIIPELEDTNDARGFYNAGGRHDWTGADDEGLISRLFYAFRHNEYDDVQTFHAGFADGEFAVIMAFEESMKVYMGGRENDEPLFTDSLHEHNPVTSLIAEAYRLSMNDRHLRESLQTVFNHLYHQTIEPYDDYADERDMPPHEKGYTIYLGDDHQFPNRVTYKKVTHRTFHEAVQVHMIPDGEEGALDDTLMSHFSYSSPLLRVIRRWRVLHECGLNARRYVTGAYDVNSNYVNMLCQELFAYHDGHGAISPGGLQQILLAVDGSISRLNAAFE